MHILTITLNAAVDATYVVDRLTVGGANRVRRLYQMPGGKGNNVARVLRAQGHAVTATGFLGGSTGAFIEARLRETGVTPAFVWLETGASRTCHTILDAEQGEATEVLEAGPELTARDGERLLGHLPALLETADAVVISGSAPAGVTRPFLERLARLVRDGTGRMIVDSSGETLAALLAGRPDLIKPNAAEMAALMGRDVSVEEQIAFARDDLIGARLAPEGYVLLSRGSEGAVLVFGDGAVGARPPAGRAVNTVGCGDALLAGYVDGWLRGAAPPDALRQAVAFGAAAARQPVAGIVDAEDVARLEPDVHLTGDAGGVERERAAR
ncbi:MAG TPA: 1-phosphofructokinase family hexose kinase [Thermomicrobiales bacterium]|nr:1-phosphofructokinase family hexose kinase [Thermomicrobiales bacterium]